MLKRTEAKLYSILFLALTIVVVLLSLRAVNPPAVVKSNAPDTAFSAERAYQHILQIARAPHSIGTAEHERVRTYIVTASNQLGLSTEIQNTTILDATPNTLIAANVHNIIAYIKGTRKGKAILNIAHYDSQPNTPGAADDGMGVASMLEVARALKALPAMKNDIVFLFTDGEEEGLLGAKAFTEEDTLFKNIGVAANWDFRGNNGITITYETSAENGWLMRQYAKGVKYPIANSMGYEISKRMPNYVDFSYFRKANITGFANGLLGGYAYYHSMADNTENLDRGSLQQVGDNMLSMMKQIGNLPLENTKAPDLSYFNVFGYWLIYYPSSLNLFFIIATTLLFIIILFIGIRRKKIRLPGFIAGVFALPIVMAATYFSSAFVLKKIINHYPLYRHFYDNNSYNSGWYFLTMTMLALFLFSLIYEPILRKWGLASSFAGILLFTVACMLAAYIYTPSACWLVFIPLLVLLAGYTRMLRKNKEDIEKTSRQQLAGFISVLPVILLFAPLTYFIFLSFGLGNALPAVAIMVVFIAALSYPVLSNVFKSHRWLISSLCLIGLVFSLFMANRNSGFNKKHPLQTNVMYHLNATDSTAVWLSDFNTTDKFSDKFFPDKKTDTSFKNRKRLIHAAPVLYFQAPVAIVKKDTSYQDVRELTLLCYAMRNDVNNMGIIIDDSTLFSVKNIQIDGKEFKKTREAFSFLNQIIFYGVPKQGFIIKFTMMANKKLGIKLFDRSMGLPAITNLTEYPDDVIPGPGFNSNTTQVEKHFVL